MGASSKASERLILIMNLAAVDALYRPCMLEGPLQELLHEAGGSWTRLPHHRDGVHHAQTWGGLAPLQ